MSSVSIDYRLHDACFHLVPHTIPLPVHFLLGEGTERQQNVSSELAYSQLVLINSVLFDILMVGLNTPPSFYSGRGI